MARLILIGLFCGLIGALAGISFAKELDLPNAVIQFSLLGTVIASSAGWHLLKTRRNQ